MSHKKKKSNTACNKSLLPAVCEGCTMETHIKTGSKVSCPKTAHGRRHTKHTFPIYGGRCSGVNQMHEMAFPA